MRDRAAAVDAFEMVLRRLKAMAALRVTDIRSCFCTGGMWMNVGVEGQVHARLVSHVTYDAPPFTVEQRTQNLMNSIQGAICCAIPF